MEIKPTRKILRPILLALLFIGASLLCVDGQATQPSNPPQGSQPQSSPSEPEVKQAPPQRGVAQELAHETREAAGEEKDETEQFKQSPSVQMISKWTGLDLRRSYWLCVILNFLVIAGVIVWAARKAVPGMLSARTIAIQKAMQEAQKEGAEARARLAEIEARLQKLDVEIGMMRDAAEKEAAAEEARIQSAAVEEASKIVAASEQEIAAAAKAARRQLTAHAAELALGLAQKQIRVDAATDQALVRGFSAELASDRRKDGN